MIQMVKVTTKKPIPKAALNKKLKPLKVVSLFAGAGGIDLGLKKAGLDIVWAVDNDADCVETYRKNIGEHIICADITTIKSKDIPDADIIVGGFPCQGFSMANRFRSTEDTRNTLYLEMLRIIKDKKPKWFIAENVKGILSLGGGEIFKGILSDFSKAGYRVNYQLVNMADHGVPQLRKRVLIIGTRKDLPENLTAIHPEPTHSKDSKDNKQNWVSISEALKLVDRYKENFPNNIGSKYKVEFRNFTGHRKTDPQAPSPTILARGNGKGGVCAIPHPNGKRRLTIRESASVQTFPIDFEFVGSINSMYRQIGNAVPVEYGKKLGSAFIKLMKVYE
jgi:DNA (cytosine-5)-methyltransferase 1